MPRVHNFDLCTSAAWKDLDEEERVTKWKIQLKHKSITCKKSKNLVGTINNEHCYIFKVRFITYVEIFTLKGSAT